MNAALAVAWEVEDMSVEERVAKIESDMGHVRSTLTDVKDDVKSLRGEVQEVKGEIQQVRGELQSFKTDVAKEFGLVRGEIAAASAQTAVAIAAASAQTAVAIAGARAETAVAIAGARAETATLRTDMEKGFGLVMTEIAKVHTAIAHAKLWVMALMVTGLGYIVGHQLKLF
jgi:TolA-binding protein